MIGYPYSSNTTHICFVMALIIEARIDLLAYFMFMYINMMQSRKTIEKKQHIYAFVVIIILFYGRKVMSYVSIDIT
jgi:hypothetical protein